jgi:hypothetical protein
MGEADIDNIRHRTLVAILSQEAVYLYRTVQDGFQAKRVNDTGSTATSSDHTPRLN